MESAGAVALQPKAGVIGQQFFEFRGQVATCRGVSQAAFEQGYAAVAGMGQAGQGLLRYAAAGCQRGGGHRRIDGALRPWLRI